MKLFVSFFKRKIIPELLNYWNLGRLDNKARYAKTYLGEIWISLSVVLLSTILGSIYGDIFGEVFDGQYKYFTYLALGITLWNNLADSMATGASLILSNAYTITNTNYSLRSLFLRKFSFISQNLIIGLSSILFVIAFVNKQVVLNYPNLILPIIAFQLFLLLILLLFSLIGCLIRDFAELVPLLTTILFLGSPILYPASKLKGMSWTLNFNLPYLFLDIVRSSVLSPRVSNINIMIIIVFELILISFLLWFLEKIRHKIALWCD